MAEPWFPYLEIGVPKVMNSYFSLVYFPTAPHLVISALSRPVSCPWIIEQIHSIDRLGTENSPENIGPAIKESAVWWSRETVIRQLQDSVLTTVRPEVKSAGQCEESHLAQVWEACKDFPEGKSCTKIRGHEHGLVWLDHRVCS